jgi:hypothetical protein
MGKTRSVNIKTCELIMSYPHLVQPQQFEPEKPGDPPPPPRYNCVGIISPEQQKTPEFKRMQEEAIKARDSFFKGERPRGLRNPFRKCEDMWKTDPETGKLIPEPGYMAGGLFISLNAGTEKPDCRDQKMKEVTSASVLYAGCKFRAVVRPYGYDRRGNKGVAFGLQTLQKIGEGENIAGRVNAADYFEPVEDLQDNATTGATTGDDWDDGEDPNPDEF